MPPPTVKQQSSPWFISLTHFLLHIWVVHYTTIQTIKFQWSMLNSTQNIWSINTPGSMSARRVGLWGDSWFPVENQLCNLTLHWKVLPKVALAIGGRVVCDCVCVFIRISRESWMLPFYPAKWWLVTQKIGKDSRKINPWRHVILHKLATYN